MKTLILFILVVSLLVFSGCATVRKDFKKTQEFDTIETYEEFLVKHPHSEYEKEVREKIEELEWQRAKSLNTLSSYQENLRKYPSGRFRTKAEAEIEKFYWEEVKRQNTIDSYTEYLNQYSEGNYNQEARIRIEKLKWQKTKSLNTIAAYQEYLTKYPKSKFVEEAQSKIDDIENYIKNARKAFYNAIHKNIIKSLSQFIKAYPESELVEDAVTAIWEILSTYFPKQQYHSSTTLKRLHTYLPEAIIKNYPFLVAFTPSRVYGKGYWSWTTYFRELAGQSLTIGRMTPRIETSNGEVYTSYSNAMDNSIEIQPWGKASHSWGCTGELTGSTVTLRYDEVEVSTKLTEDPKASAHTEYSSFTISKNSKVTISGNTEKWTLSKSPLEVHINVSTDSVNSLWQTAEMSIEGGPFFVYYDGDSFLSVDNSPKFEANVSGQITWSTWPGGHWSREQVGQKKASLVVKNAKVHSIGKLRFPIISGTGSLFWYKGQTIDNCVRYMPEKVKIEVKKIVKKNKGHSVTKKIDLGNGLVKYTTKGVKNGHIDMILVLLPSGKLFLVPFIF